MRGIDSDNRETGAFPDCVGMGERPGRATNFNFPHTSNKATMIHPLQTRSKSVEALVLDAFDLAGLSST